MFVVKMTWSKWKDFFDDSDWCSVFKSWIESLADCWLNIMIRGPSLLTKLLVTLTFTYMCVQHERLTVLRRPLKPIGPPLSDCPPCVLHRRTKSACLGR